MHFEPIDSTAFLQANEQPFRKLLIMLGIDHSDLYTGAALAYRKWLYAPEKTSVPESLRLAAFDLLRRMEFFNPAEPSEPNIDTLVVFGSRLPIITHLLTSTDLSPYRQIFGVFGSQPRQASEVVGINKALTPQVEAHPWVQEQRSKRNPKGQLRFPTANEVGILAWLAVHPGKFPNHHIDNTEGAPTTTTLHEGNITFTAFKASLCKRTDGTGKKLDPGCTLEGMSYELLHHFSPKFGGRVACLSSPPEAQRAAECLASAIANTTSHQPDELPPDKEFGLVELIAPELPRYEELKQVEAALHELAVRCGEFVKCNSLQLPVSR